MRVRAVEPGEACAVAGEDKAAREGFGDILGCGGGGRGGEGVVYLSRLRLGRGEGCGCEGEDEGARGERGAREGIGEGGVC